MQPRSLIKQVEQLVDSIESGTGHDSVVELAAQVVAHFGAELGIRGGRVFARDGADYVLRAAFPDGLPAGEPIRVPESYPPIVRLLEHGFVLMGPDEPGVDPELEKRLGASTFAAIWVGGGEECDCILSFDVAEGSQGDDIRFSLSILRHSINHRLRQAWVGNIFSEARLIQTSILPRRAPDFGHFDIAGRSDPMEFVGGDYFDYIELSPKILGVAIADASGHGLPAALQVRDVYMGLRMGLTHEFKILPTVERLNEIVSRSTLTSRFVSLFYGEVELNGNFIYVNAGHPPPLHIRRDGEVRRLRRGGAVLGPIPEGSYERGFVRLRRSDTLVLFSDGIVETEGQTARGIEEYGEHRLISQIMECAPLSAAETVEAVFEDVEKFDLRDQQQDDRTLVILKGPP